METNSETNKLIETAFSCNISTFFKHDLIRDMLKSKFENPKNKITEDAVELMCELTKILVVEASLRAAHQAIKDNETTIKLDHVEVTLPQLMLDFS